MVLFVPLAIVFIVSLLGLTGGVLLIYREKWAKLISKYLISFAVGAMLGVVFLNLLPESIGSAKSTETVMIYSLIGFLIFYVFEKSLLWYHHHSEEHVWHGKHTREEKLHPVGYLLTLGDSLHNFTDGVVMAAGFIINFKLGITTTLAVLFHEIPEEVGIFAVLLHSGFGRFKTMLYSLLAQMTAVLGCLIGLYYLPIFKSLQPLVLAIAAGGFIYIASTDLLPEIHKEKSFAKSILQMIILFMGIFVIWLVAKAFPA